MSKTWISDLFCSMFPTVSTGNVKSVMLERCWLPGSSILLCQESSLLFAEKSGNSAWELNLLRSAPRNFFNMKGLFGGASGSLESWLGAFRDLNESSIKEFDLEASFSIGVIGLITRSLLGVDCRDWQISVNSATAFSFLDSLTSGLRKLWSFASEGYET